MDQAERMAWLEKRRESIGGSDIAVILGLSSGTYASPFTVWAEKVGLLPVDAEMDDRALMGLLAEPFLAKWATHEIGMEVIAQQVSLWHPAIPFFSCTLDGRVPEAEATWECKTRNVFGFPDNQLPLDIVAQARWGLYIAGKERCYVTVGFANWRARTWLVEQDETDIRFMVAAAHQFWRLVEDQIPPPVDDSDATHEALARLYPEHVEGMSKQVDKALVARLARLRKVRSHLAKRIKAAENELAAELAEAEYGVDADGNQLLTYRLQKRAAFTTPANEFRVLRVKGIPE